MRVVRGPFVDALDGLIAAAEAAADASGAVIRPFFRARLGTDLEVGP